MTVKEIIAKYEETLQYFQSKEGPYAQGVVSIVEQFLKDLKEIK